MTMILDTTFVIDIMRNDGKAVEKLHEMQKSHIPLSITSLTIFELFSSIEKSKKKAEEKNKILKALKDQVVMPFDNEAAEIAGESDGRLIKDGRMIGAVDCMIAGIALSRKEKVLTRNIKDFARIKGLELESY